MKRIIIALVSCLLLACMPFTSFAQKTIYIGNSTSSRPSGPKRGPVLDFLTVEVNQDSCQLCITFSEDVPDCVLSLTKNSETYEEDELDAVSGQTIVYDLVNYDVGEYTLTIEVDGTIIAIIAVIIEECE